MADRISGLIALLIVIAYGIIAFAVIEAPFQYDPLGPESWPQILAVVAGLCCLYILILPDGSKFNVAQRTLIRIAVVLVMLSGYAVLYEPLGFILSTALFCMVFSLILGSTYKEAILFGIASGVFGYLLCAKLLDLNLPEGLLSFIS